MQKIVIFLKTSPLSKGGLILHISVLTLLAAFLIWGAIYQFINEPANLGNFAYPSTAAIIIVFAIWRINPPKIDEWLAKRGKTKE